MRANEGSEKANAPQNDKKYEAAVASEDQPEKSKNDENTNDEVDEKEEKGEDDEEIANDEENNDTEEFNTENDQGLFFRYGHLLTFIFMLFENPSTKTNV